MSDDLSPKMRSYLAEVYRLEDVDQSEDGYVGTSALADVMLVSPPAVNRIVNRLKDLHLLDHEPYHGIRLTSKGRAEALKQLRVLRIAEAFLATVMGFEWKEIYEEASRMSAALSEPLIERMANMSGNPTYCPHGEPIPKEDGSIELMQDFRLPDTQAGTSVQVTRMCTREADRLIYLQALGIVPGVSLDVLHMAPFDGPMQLKIKDEYRIIGNSLAKMIRVRTLLKEKAEQPAQDA